MPWKITQKTHRGASIVTLTETIMFIPAIILAMAIPIIIMDSRQLGKATILYFESDKEARIVRQKVKDGVVQMGDKTWLVDKAKPFIIPVGNFIRGFSPLYIIKWNQAEPLTMEKAKITSAVTPENLSRLLQNKTLANLLNPQETTQTMILYIVIGIAIGAMGGYIIGGGI